MRFPRTLFLYLTREILLYGALAFVSITTLLMGQNLFRRLDDLVVVGFGPSDLLTLLANIAPLIIAHAAPVSFLFGVSLAMARLSSDSELLAMSSAGLGMRSLVATPLGLGICVSGLTAFLVISVEPQAQRDLRAMFKTVATRGGLLEPGRFRNILGRVIFVESRDRENRLGGILISDRSRPERPFLIFAERGRFEFDDERELIRISLERGSIHLDEGYPAADGQEERLRYQQIAFRNLSYVFDVSAVLSGKTTQLRPREMTLGELRENLEKVRAGVGTRMLRAKDPIDYELQIQRRFALPFAPLLFAVVAVPLGLRRSRNARSVGTLISLILVFGYYSLQSLTELLAHEGWTGAGFALWSPNVVFALIGLGLMRRATRVGRT